MFLGKRWLRGGDIVTSMLNKAFSAMLRLVTDTDGAQSEGQSDCDLYLDSFSYPLSELRYNANARPRPSKQGMTTRHSRSEKTPNIRGLHPVFVLQLQITDTSINGTSDNINISSTNTRYSSNRYTSNTNSTSNNASASNNSGSSARPSRNLPYDLLAEPDKTAVAFTDQAAVERCVKVFLGKLALQVSLSQCVNLRVFSL